MSLIPVGSKCKIVGVEFSKNNDSIGHKGVVQQHIMGKRDSRGNREHISYSISGIDGTHANWNVEPILKRKNKDIEEVSQFTLSGLMDSLKHKEEVI